MVTILRAQGLSFVIFTDDHEPAHVHVFGDGHAKINLFGAGGAPELVWAHDMKRSDLRKALKLVSTHSLTFFHRWRAIHDQID